MLPLGLEARCEAWLSRHPLTPPQRGSALPATDLCTGCAFFPCPFPPLPTSHRPFVEDHFLQGVFRTP